MKALISEMLPRSYAWLLAMLRPVGGYVREVAIISLFTNILALAIPIFVLQVYDRVIAHQGLSTLTALACGAALAVGFDFILRQSRARLLQRVSLTLDAALGRALYRKIMSLPLQALERRPASAFAAYFADGALIRSVLAGPAAVTVIDLPFALLFFAVVAVIAWPVAWVLLLIMAAFCLLSYASTRALARAAAREQGAERTRERMTAELLAHRGAVKALGIGHSIAPEWEGLHAQAILQAAGRGAETDTYSALGASLAMLSTLLIVSVGALAIVEREMTMGALIAANMLSSRIILPFNQLVSLWKQYAGAHQAVSRLDRLFAEPSERMEAGMSHAAPKGAIRVENLTFAYAEDAPPVLNEVSLAIQPGEIVGFVGRNGCGKSTLLKLLQGLYEPQEGRVLLDGADIAQYSREELSRWIGYTPQECALFSGTVRENIAKAKPEAEDDAIFAAARASGAEGFIKELPEGYATQTGEGGTRLSGGQRQRLAIARALLSQPPLLLLDEPSSGLDIQSELALRETILGFSGKRTVVLATHSIVLLQACTRIFVFEKGHIVMHGPAHEVLAKIAGSKPLSEGQEAKRA